MVFAEKFGSSPSALHKLHTKQRYLSNRLDNVNEQIYEEEVEDT